MSCEYYIPNTEELDYVGTKDLKVQSLDLLWSLRLFPTFSVKTPLIRL